MELSICTFPSRISTEDTWFMPKPLQLRAHSSTALKSGQEKNKYCHLTVKAALAFLIYSKHFLWQTTGFFISELRLKTKSQQEHNSNLDRCRKMYWWTACPLNCKSKHTWIFSDMIFARELFCLLSRLWHDNFTEGMLRMDYWQCSALSTLKICTFLKRVDWCGGFLSNYRH